MALIDWMDDYSVGVLEMDLQHQKLVEILNQLNDTMATGAERRRLEEGIDELIAYTRHHFAYEERLMRDTRYPGLDEHLGKHTALIAQVLDLRTKALAGTAAALKWIWILKDWLMKHILETDIQYRDHVLLCRH